MLCKVCELTFLIISTASIQLQAVLFSVKMIRDVSQGMLMMVACKESGREGKMSAVGICIFSGVPPNRISLKMPLLRLAASRGTSKNML